MDALNAYFVQKVDTTYARHCFRQLTLRQFENRLRWAEKYCDYGGDPDNQIRDGILCKCTRTYIMGELLGEVPGLRQSAGNNREREKVDK